MFFNRLCEVTYWPMVTVKDVNTGETFETRLSNLVAMNDMVEDGYKHIASHYKLALSSIRSMRDIDDVVCAIDNALLIAEPAHIMGGEG